MNLLSKIFVFLILLIIFFLLLGTICLVGVSMAHTILEEPNNEKSVDYKESTDYSYSSPSYHQEDEGPVPYYDTGFYVYTYQDNPATCGGGKCPKSQFAYV